MQRANERSQPRSRVPRIVAGVILAAGRSARLGRPKQLLLLGGRPLLQHVLAAACASTLDEVVVVLGAGAAAIAAVLEAGRARLVVNDGYAAGQSSSIQYGLAALGERIEGALVLLGDQPSITAGLINLVVSRYRAEGAVIVAPRFADGLGNPVLFDRVVWPELLRLRGDTGAREVLRARRGEVLEVPVAGERLPDVDTWEEYARLQAAGGRLS